jgi:hypothetical protein
MSSILTRQRLFDAALAAAFVVTLLQHASA